MNKYNLEQNEQYPFGYELSPEEEMDLYMNSSYSGGRIISLEASYRKTEHDEVFMSVYAYDPADVTRALVEADEWVVLHRTPTGYKDGCCPVCKGLVYIRGHDSTGHRPHFVHYKNSMCPTVPENHNPYNQFRNLPRDINLAKENKKWVWENLNTIRDKIRAEFPSLQFSWGDFISVIRGADQYSIWSLKDMPTGYIPYVLLACVDRFYQTGYRKHECYFVLEPTPDGPVEAGAYWNQTGSIKRSLWQVQLPSRNVIQHEIKTDVQPVWYMGQIDFLLKGRT
ncbi:hypothetical protein M8D54_004962 [Salmonella enterica]|uniref:Uncharacterized protein n=1 Tax=Salmonella enterica TaxID=28901 RepID=A0A629KHP5_SALER|nr:hypothetical protein [Salmonella enterica]EDF8922141.1 hypothetical protein [Salmonella enterica]EGR6194420.1 hypothetical protein [Salmonella enterica]EHR7428488.1 hypothetical protein [Salmonella enterica]EJF2005544.1 hypothetical protein [Salmonella enterica]